MFRENSILGIFLFSIIWGLERLSLTLFNLSVAKFLTLLMFNNHFTVVATVYLVLQTLPLALFSLFVGMWIDTVNRAFVVSRTLAIRAGCTITTLLFSALLVTLHLHVSVLTTVPLLMFLIISTIVTGALHLILHIITERIWVVNAAQRCGDTSRFLLKCNSAMSIARDTGQLVALVMFDGLSTHVTPPYIFLTVGVVMGCATLNQWLCYRAIDQTHLPRQIRFGVAQRRSVKRACLEYVSHPDAPTGMCWAARSTFTAQWIATTFMEHCSASILHRMVYFGSTVTSALGYIWISPKFKNHVLLVAVAMVEVVLVGMTTTSVSLATFQDTVNGGSLLRAAQHAYQHSGPITLNEINPSTCSVAVRVVGYLTMVIGSVCLTIWNLTALQVYQEEVQPHSRGTMGGIQLFLDYTVLSLHALLAVTFSGKQYVMSCAVIGGILTIFNLAALLFWKRVKSRRLESLIMDNEEAHYNMAFQDTDA